MKKFLEKKIFLGFDYLHKYLWSCMGFMCMYELEIYKTLDSCIFYYST